MKIGILGTAGTWHVEELRRASIDQNIETMVLDYSQLPIHLGMISRHAEDNLHAIIVRHVPGGTLDQTLHCLNVLHYHAHYRTVTNTPRSIEFATDKILAGIQLDRHHIPIPKTIAVDSLSMAMESYEIMNRQIVVKPQTGSLGRGITRIDDPDIAWRVFHSLIQVGSTILIQEYIPTDGWDIRLFVIAGCVVAAMRRSSPLDWRYNIARGGFGELYKPTDRQIELAIATADVIGTHYCGIDILHDREGRDYVLEINAIPGWKTLQEVTKANIADHIIEHLVTML